MTKMLLPDGKGRQEVAPLFFEVIFGYYNNCSLENNNIDSLKEIFYEFNRQISGAVEWEISSVDGTKIQDVPGLEEEINNNAVYIRYSAQKSFEASIEAVHGLLSGEMDETQAYDTLRSVMNRKDPEEKATVNFENEYSISLNDRNGRDAASSILTTIREENNAQLALAPYYYFTSSIYKGECTNSRVGMMTAKSSDTPLYFAKINGKQVYELVEKYLADADENYVT